MAHYYIVQQKALGTRRHTWHTMNAIGTFDLTVREDEISKEKLMQYFNKICTKWAFQKEKGEDTGFIHYHCRFTLTKKVRLCTQISKMQVGLETSSFHLSPTSNEIVKKGGMYYVMKDETRVDGPWRGNLELNNVDPFWRDMAYRPWQQTIVDEMNSYKPEIRTINLIVSKTGNEGKTHLSNHLLAAGKIYLIPPLNNYKDALQFMMSMYKEGRAIFVDVPRGLSYTAKQAFYSAIETIKSGYLYGTLYSGKAKTIRPPCLYIFANDEPDYKCLSKNRWNVRFLKKVN